MVRSAAKNHAFVTILTSPAQYEALLAEMDAGRGLDSGRRVARFPQFGGKRHGKTSCVGAAN